MAFLKRSLARLDHLFKKKQESRSKFYECVEKVIEARRSGCIDEDGNIVKPLDELLQKHEAKVSDVASNGLENEPKHKEEARVPNYRVSVVEPRPRPRARLIKGIPPTYTRPDKLRKMKEEMDVKQKQSRQRQKQQRRRSPVIVDGVISPRLATPANSSDEDEEERPKRDRITAVSNPMYRESFPLPEEDDGSEGYASASEVDHFEFNPTAFLERNRTSGNPLHHHVHRNHGDDSDQSDADDDDDSRSAARRVRFSDDVQDIENFIIGGESSISSDPTALPVHTKIDLFEKVTCMKVTPPLMNRHSDPGPRIPPRPSVARLQSSVTKDKVSLFEELSNPEMRPVPPPRPRRRKLESKMNETKLKINFFEQLSRSPMASSPLSNRASTPCL